MYKCSMTLRLVDIGYVSSTSRKFSGAYVDTYIVKYSSITYVLLHNMRSAKSDTASEYLSCSCSIAPYPFLAIVRAVLFITA